MLALVIILAILAIILLIACFVIHADRKKTHEVFLFMSDMVNKEGEALQKSLRELEESSQYAEPAESAAALKEITRFLVSFNETVSKQAQRVEEWQKNSWYKGLLGIFKKKKPSYTLPSKKKETETAEKEEEKESELEELDKKLEEKISEKEPKPVKKVKRLKKRIRKSAEEEKKEDSGGTEENKSLEDNDEENAIDLPPPPQD